jgi:hypothetical protein
MTEKRPPIEVHQSSQEFINCVNHSTLADWGMASEIRPESKNTGFYFSEPLGRILFFRSAV